MVALVMALPEAARAVKNAALILAMEGVLPMQASVNLTSMLMGTVTTLAEAVSAVNLALPVIVKGGVWALAAVILLRYRMVFVIAKNAFAV